MQVHRIKKIYCAKRKDIRKRLGEFRRVWRRNNDKEIFAELAFCILTPQSKARTCWEAVSNLVNKDILWNGSERRILGELKGVRFKYKKAKFILRARRLFTEIKSALKQKCRIFETRNWLVGNVKGLGLKEASHFLRNIGRGKDIAILDRHILRNLKRLKVIDDIPDSLSKKRYLEIEKNMIKFAKRIDIPVDSLDLALWSKETGEVFK